MGNELTNAETGGQIVSVLEEIRVDDWLGLMREENKFDDNAEYEEYERLLMDRDQLKKEAGQIRTRWRRT